MKTITNNTSQYTCAAPLCLFPVLYDSLYIYSLALGGKTAGGIALPAPGLPPQHAMVTKQNNKIHLSGAFVSGFAVLRFTLQPNIRTEPHTGNHNQSIKSSKRHTSTREATPQRFSMPVWAEFDQSSHDRIPPTHGHVVADLSTATGGRKPCLTK